MSQSSLDNTPAKTDTGDASPPAAEASAVQPSRFKDIATTIAILFATFAVAFAGGAISASS